MFFNRSLSPLFESPKLDPELGLLIRETFPEFCSSGNDLPSNMLLGGSEPLSCRDNIDIIIETNKTNNHNSELEARFSDDESESSNFKQIKPVYSSNEKPIAKSFNLIKANCPFKLRVTCLIRKGS